MKGIEKTAIPQENLKLIAEVQLTLLKIRKTVTQINHKMEKHNHNGQEVYKVGSLDDKKNNK